ncbi:MAG: hypothetical protein AAF939_03770 [Planctomycetota bacterium]
MTRPFIETCDYPRRPRKIFLTICWITFFVCIACQPTTASRPNGYRSTQISVDESVEVENSQGIPNPIKQRVFLGALLGSTILALLAIIFVYLRLNSVSRGFYTGKLQTWTIIAALIVVATSFMAYNYWILKV